MKIEKRCLFSLESSVKITKILQSVAVSKYQKCYKPLVRNKKEYKGTRQLVLIINGISNGISGVSTSQVL
jgi:hypothetical protein